MAHAILNPGHHLGWQDRGKILPLPIHPFGSDQIEPLIANGVNHVAFYPRISIIHLCRENTLRHLVMVGFDLAGRGFAQRDDRACSGVESPIS